MPEQQLMREEVECHCYRGVLDIDVQSFIIVYVELVSAQIVA